jgi:hypothetical protein
MVSNVAVNDRVFVPRTLLGLDPQGPSPFHRTVVRHKHQRSVRVELPNGSMSARIGTSRIFRNLGLLIIRVGDYEEQTLLDPLTKSVLQFCRILLPDDHVLATEVRTIEELRFLWNKHHRVVQQVILIGHGSPRSMRFGSDDIDANEFIETLAAANPAPKEFISLCCKTGQAPFAKPISEAALCVDFLAPYHSVHGCIASQFCQNYMTLRLLDGMTTGSAFNKTRKNLIGAASFRRWHNGKLKSGPK